MAELDAALVQLAPNILTRKLKPDALHRRKSDLVG